MPINVYIIICLVITLLYFIGILVFLNDHEQNKCEMTYMFEYPQFVRVSMKRADHLQPKYGLYAYSEGTLTERARNMHFDGIPVLFVPGNAGSYRQVRSLASIALRKTLNSRSSFHFDYFTVDLNDELSCLNGAVLYEQMVYVNQSIYRILDLYARHRNPVKSIVLIGHSMGGIIARAILNSLSNDSDLVPILLTLSTPHERPPIILDDFLYSFYKRLQNGLPKNTTLVSLSGGYGDFLVPSYLTRINNSQSLHVVTTSVPRSWLPADHLCILWCKQLILAINRALFDSVDTKTKQITADVDYRKSVFEHHLISHNGIKMHQIDRYTSSPSNIDNQGDWIENLNRQYSVRLLQGTKKTQWHMIRHVDQPKHEVLTVVAINLENVNWVYVCPAIHVRGYSRICIEAKHLSHLSEIAPSARYKRRMLTINIHELKKNYTEMTHVVFKVVPTQEPIIFHVDVFNSNERRVMVNLPSVFSFKHNVVVQETDEKAVSYELILPDLYRIIQSYQMFITPVKCTNENHHATASLIVPWGNENYHIYVTETEQKPLHIRLYSPKPRSHLSKNATVRLVLDPTCRYQISVKSSLTGVLGQLARFYSPFLVANIAAIVLLTLRQQLMMISTKQYCQLFFVALKDGTKPYYLVGFLKLATRLLSGKLATDFLPVPDWTLMNEERIDFFILPLLLYLCSVGVVWLLAIAFTISLVVCESAVNKITLKFLARSLTGIVTLSDYLMTVFKKLPFLVAGTLVFLSVSSCGGLALCLGTVFYFIKLTQMSQDYIEDVVWKVLKLFARRIKDSLRRDCKKEKTENKIAHQADGDGLNVDRETQKAAKLTLKTNDSTKGDGDNIISNDDSTEGNGDNLIKTADQIGKNESDNQTNKAKKPNDNESITEQIKLLSNDSIFFHFTIFFLWSIVAFINIPSVLTWAHNFKYNTTLHPDPSFLPGIILSFCSLPLWQLDVPDVNKKWHKELSHVLFLVAGISLIYTPICIYRLTYILTSVIVTITLHQVFAPQTDGSDSNESTKEDEIKPSELYENVKAKLE